MKLGNLKNIDSTFTIINGNEDLVVAGITDSFQLAHHHLVFI